NASIANHMPAVQQYCSAAQRLNGSHIMTYKKNGSPFLCYTFHLSQAFLLKSSVSHRQHLVYDQDLWLQVSSHGKGQAQVHSAGIMLHRRVNEFFDLGKGYDFVKFSFNLSPCHAQDRAVEINIFAPGQFRVKSSAYLEQ